VAPRLSRIAGSAMAVIVPSMKPKAEARIAESSTHLRLSGAQRGRGSETETGAELASGARPVTSMPRP
jgi:hypothetical protein